MLNRLYFIITLLFSIGGFSDESRESYKKNPFAIDFPCKEVLTIEDYIQIQAQLRSIDIHPISRSLHLENGLIPYEDLYMRMSRGILQTLIDLENKKIPTMELVKIGHGGENCIVTFASYNGSYAHHVDNIAPELEKCGFDGYFLSLKGGFPNPTGLEIQYVGVPYSFKIFMMLEAQKLGFTQVLWIDSALTPLKDPTPIFEYIESNGALFMGDKMTEVILPYIPVETRRLLKELTGIDILETHSVAGGIFGLKMDSRKTEQLIEEFYRLAELGTPFLSCFPEELVWATLGAKINQEDEYGVDIIGSASNPWRQSTIPRLMAATKSDDEKSIEKIRQDDVYFHLSLQR